MGQLTHLLNQVAQVITTTTSKFGDQIFSNSEEIPCRFRYITNVDQTNNAELYSNIDAIFWCEPDQPIIEGTILFVDDEYWRVQRLIKARKFDPEKRFLKAFLRRHKLAGL